MSYLLNVKAVLDESIHNCEYKIDFIKSNSGYGNNTYMKVSNTITNITVWYLDIRYDRSYKSDRQLEYICKWACNNWSGDNDSYKLKEIAIIEIN